MRMVKENEGDEGGRKEKWEGRERLRGTKKIWHGCLKEERHKYIAAAKCVVGHYIHILYVYYVCTYQCYACVCMYIRTTHACTNSGSGWVGT